MVERTRSFEISVSPCATYEGCDGYSGPSDSDNSVSPDDVDPATSHPEAPAESSPRGPDSGSQSSTVVDPASYNGSMMTLINEGSIYEIPEDSKDPKFFLKESIRYSSPLVHAISPALTPCVMSARKDLPFNPEDLARALIAVQVCA